MPSSPCWKWLRSPVVLFGLLLAVTVCCRGGPGCADCGPRCLEDLQRLSPEQVQELYRQAELGTPLVGCARGRLLFLTDEKMPRLKVRLGNSVWRGKAAEEDGYFINRWPGRIRWIDSHYVIGPSWVDGKPSVIMEYAPGTALFWNMHDELREVAPGLYLGPVYERFPCPKLRGYIGLECEPCERRWRH
jgi:hypothetical protein